MTELIYSPVFYAILWTLAGAIQVAISYTRKESVGFFQSMQSLVFGPVSLATELLQIATSPRSANAVSKEVTTEVDQTVTAAPIVPIETHVAPEPAAQFIKWNPLQVPDRKRHDYEKKRA